MRVPLHKPKKKELSIESILYGSCLSPPPPPSTLLWRRRSSLLFLPRPYDRRAHFPAHYPGICLGLFSSIVLTQPFSPLNSRSFTLSILNLSRIQRVSFLAIPLFEFLHILLSIFFLRPQSLCRLTTCSPSHGLQRPVGVVPKSRLVCLCPLD